MHLETQRESLRPSVSPEKKATSSSNSHQKILHDDLKLSESDDSDDD